MKRISRYRFALRLTLHASRCVSADAFCYSGGMTTVAEIPSFRRRGAWLIAGGKIENDKPVVSPSDQPSAISSSFSGTALAQLTLRRTTHGARH